MPRAFARLLAVLLLALVVPVQAMAAVAASQCKVLGHHQDAGAHEPHAHDLEGAEGHDHAAHSHPDQGGAKPGHEHGKKDAHCGPCTGCCASASIAGPVGISIASSPSSATYLFSQFAPLGVQPDGLDRPPLAL